MLLRICFFISVLNISGVFSSAPREPIKILIVCADAQSVIEKSCRMWYTVKNHLIPSDYFMQRKDFLSMKHIFTRTICLSTAALYLSGCSGIHSLIEPIMPEEPTSVIETTMAVAEGEPDFERIPDLKAYSKGDWSVLEAALLNLDPDPYKPERICELMYEWGDECDENL